MALVPSDSHVFHVGSALKIGFTHLDYIDVFKAKLLNTLFDLSIKDGVNTHSLISGQHPHTVDIDPICATSLQEKV
jgi:hypothetical protein